MGQGGVSANSRWHLQNGLCLLTAARGICDVWKTILPWQKKRYLQNAPRVQWFQLMRSSHEVMRWIYRDAALLLHSHHTQSVCTSQHPAPQNKPAWQCRYRKTGIQGKLLFIALLISNKIQAAVCDRLFAYGEKD